jgi:HTH-type transcriptional regulator/antitoxin MqsA
MEDLTPTRATKSAPHCPDCDAVMARDVRRTSWTFKGKSIEFDQPAWWCPVDPGHDCVMDAADSDSTEATLLAHRVVVQGGMPPTEVRRIRERLGLSQREAGRAIGGGPIAFHRYEKGEVATSHAVGVLLRLLDLHPELLADLGVSKLVGVSAIEYARCHGAAVHTRAFGRGQALWPGVDDARIAEVMAVDPRAVHIDLPTKKDLAA